jgi:hypothetical protein
MTITRNHRYVTRGTSLLLQARFTQKQFIEVVFSVSIWAYGPCGPGGPHGYLGGAGKWSTYGPHDPHTTFLTAGLI